MATYSSTLAWRIPWTEEPGGLQSTGSQSDTTEHARMHSIIINNVLVPNVSWGSQSCPKNPLPVAKSTRIPSLEMEVYFISKKSS